MSTLRREVAPVYRELGLRGLNVGASGNVSARTYTVPARYTIYGQQPGTTKETA